AGSESPRWTWRSTAPGSRNPSTLISRSAPPYAGPPRRDSARPPSSTTTAVSAPTPAKTTLPPSITTTGAPTSRPGPSHPAVARIARPPTGDQPTRGVPAIPPSFACCFFFFAAAVVFFLDLVCGRLFPCFPRIAGIVRSSPRSDGHPGGRALSAPPPPASRTARGGAPGPRPAGGQAIPTARPSAPPAPPPPPGPSLPPT